MRDFKADVDAFALSLTISPDGQTLAGGCVQNNRQQIMVCLWDLNTGRLKANLPSEDPVSLHFTPDGKTLVSATEKGTIDIWDVRTRNQTTFDRLWTWHRAFGGSVA